MSESNVVMTQSMGKIWKEPEHLGDSYSTVDQEVAAPEFSKLITDMRDMLDRDLTQTA